MLVFLVDGLGAKMKADEAVKIVRSLGRLHGEAGLWLCGRWTGLETPHSFCLALGVSQPTTRVAVAISPFQALSTESLWVRSGISDSLGLKEDLNYICARLGQNAGWCTL
jgi:hypothetical protein